LTSGVHSAGDAHSVTVIAQQRLTSPPNKALQQTNLSLACGSLWRSLLNADTLGRQ
jgi:hypothetical protein